MAANMLLAKARKSFNLMSAWWGHDVRLPKISSPMAIGGHLFVATFAINILSLALPLTALQVYDRIIGRGGTDTLNVLSLAVLVAVVGEGVLRLCRTYITGWIGAAYEHGLACAAIGHVLKVAPLAFSGQGIGGQMHRLSAIVKLREFYSGQALITLIDLPFILVFLLLVGYLGGVLVFVPIVMLMLFALRAWSTGSKLRESLKARDKCDDKRYDFIIETLSGIHTVKSCGAEALFQRRYEALQQTSSEAGLTVANAGADAYNDGIIFSQIMMAATVLAGAPLAAYGHMSMGSLIACVLLSGRIMQPVQRALSLWTRFQDVVLAREKLADLFAIPSLFLSRDSVSTNEGRLELNNVSFRYTDESPLIIEDCTFRLEHGETVALTGDIDSGRSTLLRLMAGLLVPTGGDVLVNGVSASTLSSNVLAQQVGYMATQGVIFCGTIRENLTRFGAIPMERADEMAELLGIDREVAHLPLGYETMLDNTPADPIPPGLKQRIAVARVLAAKPRILLCDKADRALDKEGYNQVYKLLGRLKGKVTMVLVSNDQNVLQLADRKYAFQHGALVPDVETDDHHAIDMGIYRELRL